MYTSSPQPSAAIYCRISQDTDQEGLGVARQEQDCRALAERRGLAVVEVYVDNDTGASTRSRAKTRPAYARMLADARAGRFGTVLAYSNSRLTRRPLELEDLIVLHERHGVTVQTVVSGEDDLATADGRMVARIKASVDAGEVERTAERVARKHLANAQEGKPVGGTRPFGWNDDKTTVRPDEAAAIRRAAEQLLAGVPLRRVAQDFNDAGFVTTGKGQPWTAHTVRQVLRSPRLAGWRVHNPRGSKWQAVPRVAVGQDGQPVRGQWEPILDQPTYDAVVAALGKPDGRARVPRRGARHYLMTGILRCGKCNSVMYGNRAGQAHYYTCKDHGHSNTASGRAVDAYVERLVLERLAAVDLDRPAPRFQGEERLATVEASIRELMDAHSSGELSAAVVFPSVNKLEAERDALVQQRDQLAAAAAGPDLSRVDDAAWAAMDTDRRRAVVETLLDAVLVRPVTRNTGNRFDYDRLDPVWAA